MFDWLKRRVTASQYCNTIAVQKGPLLIWAWPVNYSAATRQELRKGGSSEKMDNL